MTSLGAVLLVTSVVIPDWMAAAESFKPFILDAQWNIISRHAGYKPGDERELEREIQQALARVP